jgi:DNA ligase-1
MIRLPEGVYEWGHRSPHLLKYKSFQDDEFEVVRVTTGVGRFDGCARFECKTKEGKTFGVVCRGTQEERKEQYTNRESYVGKKLTTRYFGLTEAGIPTFPVGVCFRIEEDRPK